MRLRKLRRLRGWARPRFPEAANHPTDNRSENILNMGRPITTSGIAGC